MAFFPCIYFCNLSQLAFTYDYINYRTMNIKQMTNAILERDKNRSYFYGILLKLFSIIKEKGLRMILENPATAPHYLLFPQNFVQKPTMIDYNRNARGDIYKKMTAYWFVNCSPTHRHSFEKGKELKKIAEMASGLRAGICSEERSMMTESYARNFICDNIIGCDSGVLQQPDLFE